VSTIEQGTQSAAIDEGLAVAAHRLLGSLSLIAGKAEFLRRHRREADDELCERWLSDIEATAKNLSTCLELLARGIIPDDVPAL
jgi:hypothetical protein